ncbi:nucleotidyltransferase family protein [Rubripirellula reticaptiva]|uniref:Nucleotidyltransferase family protein n=1 Tax=Rubripirellula reticaptiva TaxID=2528013 RepID=A0A5C6F1K2_9BACT|nr:nucleotidyltransferase family protein [Rubripirellula reticaptiva]TWU55228.1 hypothetical protein Poly59_15250 [Rubripirellula reticaptiva]
MPTELKPFSWERMISAVEAVRERALRATKALREAGVPHGIAGGNAVAAWVARIDEAAVRNTRDVDILVRRADFGRIQLALESVGFHYHQVMGVDCFIDGPNGSPSDAVHLLYAAEKVRPEYILPSADVTEIEPADDYDIVSLPALLTMKLNSYRDKDRMHLRDMLSVGLIDETWLEKLPPLHADRLQQLINDPDG